MRILTRSVFALLTASFLLASGPVAADDVEIQLGGPTDRFVLLSPAGEKVLSIDANGVLYKESGGQTTTLLKVGPNHSSFFVGSAGSDDPAGIESLGIGKGTLENNRGASNVAVGYQALTANTFGHSNSAFGADALGMNFSGVNNSAFGEGALKSNFGAFANSAFGAGSLSTNTNGSLNAAFGTGSLKFNNANSNAAFGSISMYYNTSGTENSAFGSYSLWSNTTGSNNTAAGMESLKANISGSSNTAIGSENLHANTTGIENVAVGSQAMFQNTTGHRNTAIGKNALSNLGSGLTNTAVGYFAGSGLTGSDSNNIMIANPAAPGDNGVIRIGNSNHTQAYIAGIYGVFTEFASPVRVNAAGFLGTTTSSARFKEGIEPMGDESDLLSKLRPVVFRYREEYAGDAGAQVPQYGLIAEEVAQVAPDLVINDRENLPFTVKYEQLTPMLLNEYQRQRRTIDDQQETIDELRGRMERLERALVSSGGAEGMVSR